MQFLNIGTLKSICENEGTRKKNDLFQHSNTLKVCYYKHENEFHKKE